MYIQGICVVCEINPQKQSGIKNGKTIYKHSCQKCDQLQHGMYKTHLLKAKHKKRHCESCGFVALHRVQLDVDHIDGNSRNNDPSNFQTLCANCHRLKTLVNGDNLNRY